jgi:septation ring formation regulator EzrA
MPPPEYWHLDKKVPISIIIALFVQTVVFVYVGTTWKADTDSRISALEKSENNRVSHENRLVILEQQFQYIRSDLAEIKSILRRQIPPPDSQP